MFMLHPPWLRPHLRCSASYSGASIPHNTIKTLLDDRIPPFQRKLFVLGLGYTGVAAARYLQHLDWEVAGTCRRPSDVAMLRDQGIQAFEYDSELDSEFSCVTCVPPCTPPPTLHSSACSAALAQSPYVLVTVPPTPRGDDPILAAHRALLADTLSLQLRWLGYLSSTSVYGDHGGRVVDERSTCTPEEGSKGWARLRAEGQWTGLHESRHLPLHVFRLGGIYGPERSALDVAARGRQGAGGARRARQRYTARVHVGDVCRVLAASMAHPSPGAVYNVVDDDPSPRGVVVRYARGLLGVPEDLGIQFAEPMADEEQPTTDDVVEVPRLAEKRVSNTRIKQDLGVALAYPTFREGLEAIVREEPEPFFYAGVEEDKVPPDYLSSPSFFSS